MTTGRRWRDMVCHVSHCCYFVVTLLLLCCYFVVTLLFRVFVCSCVRLFVCSLVRWLVRCVVRVVRFVR